MNPHPSRSRRKTALWIGAISVLPAIAWAVAAQLDASTSAKAVLAALAAAAPASLALPTLLESHRARESREDQLLFQTVGTFTEPLVGLPRVSACDIYELGVTPVKANPLEAAFGNVATYISRDLDETLRQALISGQSVLLTGPSQAGKSRTALEAVRKEFPDYRLVAPSGPQSIARLLADEAAPDLASTVLWLDDLQRFLSPEGLTISQLRAYRERAGQDAVIVATLRQTLFDSLTQPSDLHHETARILRYFATYTLPARLSPSEISRLKQRRPEHAFVRSLATLGLGEVIVGGDDLVHRLDEKARQGDIAADVVQAAAAWSRSGATSAIARGPLKELVALSVEHVIDDDFNAALAWGVEPVASGLSLLSENAGLYQVAEYIVDWLSVHSTGLRDDEWRACIRVCALASDLVTIGLRAHAAGRPNIAQEAWELAALGEDGSETECVALYNLGILLLEEGREAEASKQWGRLLKLDKPAWSTRVVLRLARLHIDRGEPERAVQYLEDEDYASDGVRTSQWLHLLGVARQQADRRLGAVAAFASAAAVTPGDAWSAASRLELGLEAHLGGDVQEAKHQYDVLSRSSSESAGWARLNLALLAWQAGDLGLAEATLLGVLRNHSGEVTTAAVRALACIADERGAVAEARRFSGLARTLARRGLGDSEREEAVLERLKSFAPHRPRGRTTNPSGDAPELMATLPAEAALPPATTRRRGKPSVTVRFCTTGTQTADRVISSLRAQYLQELETSGFIPRLTLKAGLTHFAVKGLDLRTNEPDLRALMRSQDATVRDNATLALVLTLAERNEYGTAGQVLGKVARADASESVKRACREVELLLAMADRDFGRARDLLEDDTSYPSTQEVAKLCRAGLARETGDEAEAERLFKELVDARSTTIAGVACHWLGHIYREGGKLRRAKVAWEKGARLSDNPESGILLVHASQDSLGIRRRRRQVLRHLERLARSGSDHAPWAKVVLGLDLYQHNRFARALTWFRAAARDMDPREAMYGAIYAAACELNLSGEVQSTAWYNEFVSTGRLDREAREMAAGNHSAMGPLLLALIPLLRKMNKREEALYWSEFALTEMDGWFERSKEAGSVRSAISARGLRSRIEQERALV